jgi:hypothetical protein
LLDPTKVGIFFDFKLINARQHSKISTLTVFYKNTAILSGMEIAKVYQIKIKFLSKFLVTLSS